MLQQLEKKWKLYNPNEWWGDSVDVRFHLISELKSLRNQQVLDIGCNIGLILSELDQSNEKYGFDINEGFIQLARRLNPDAHLSCRSMYDEFPYDSQSFDSVIMAHACPGYSVPDYNNRRQAVLNEVHHILKPGGSLYLTTSNKNHILHNPRRHLYPEGLFYKQVQQDLHQFRNVSIYGWNPMPPLVPFLPRYIFHKIPPSYWKFLFIPSQVLAKIPCIMHLLRWLMTKRWLLKHSKALYVVAIK